MDMLMQFVRNLGGARIIMIGGMVAFVALLFSVLGNNSSGAMAVLYAGLGPREANAVIGQLEAQNVNYVVNGSTIRVPSSQVDRLRITLAEQSISGGVVGNEIFDEESSFGRTSAEVAFNRLRAIQGELTRTIESLQGISSARVHVVLPERTPFAQSRQDPTASILLSTTGIGQRQARAIQSLVAGAVPGLSADRVAISDVAGRIYSTGEANENGQQFSTLDDYRTAQENRYAQRIQQQLERIVGPGGVDVTVALAMDLVRETTTSLTYNPDLQVVSGTTTITEESQDTDENFGVTAGNNDATTEPQGGGTTGSSERRSEETSNFLNSRSENTQIKEPGRITGLNVAVTVDQKRTEDADGAETLSQWSDAELDNLRSLVTTSVPPLYDEDGQSIEPTITLQQFAFVQPPELVPQTNLVQQALGLAPGDLVQLINSGGLVVIAMIFLLIVVRPIVMRVIEAIPDAPPPPDPNIPIESEVRPDLAQITGPQDVNADVLARAAAGDEAAQLAVVSAQRDGSLDMSRFGTDSRIDVAQVEGRLQESAIKKVADIIRNNPDDSLAIIRSWLYAEE